MHGGIRSCIILYLGLKNLKRLRGTEDVEKEYNEIKAASAYSKRTVLDSASWKALFSRRNAPQAAHCFAMPIF